jgi:glycerol-3-phosphate dehydrogenase
MYKKERIIKKILIIGAGIHGTFIAKYFKKYSVKITIIEKNSSILNETSRATHNRANRGYHYPRSIQTFNECKEAYDYFKKNYHKYLKKIPSFYCIENKSKTNFNKYKIFFKKNNLKFNIVKTNNFIKKENLEGIIKVEEGCFDHLGVSKMIKNELKSKSIKLVKNFNLQKVKNTKGTLKLININKKSLFGNFDIIINATYDKSNEILKKFKIKNLPQYFYQSTEIAVVYSKKKIPGITVMDGDFITIMPYIKKKNLYLIYDVKNSILKKNKYPIHKPKIKKNNYKSMLKKISKYINYTDDFVYKYSLYGYRPIPLDDVNSDRSTKIKISNFGDIEIYSIVEGKYISAPFIARKLVNLICKKNRIKKLQ